jgi:hypothetical protein
VKEADRITQLERTRDNRCARCGLSPGKHVIKDGSGRGLDGNEGVGPNCPDGGGTYTWAQTREEMAQTIKGLEGFLAKLKGDA